MPSLDSTEVASGDEDSEGHVYPHASMLLYLTVVAEVVAEESFSFVPTSQAQSVAWTSLRAVALCSAS